jgi:dolichol-phosphate mannosyltransferase
MKAVIILPTYNERENITDILTRLLAVTQKIKGFTFEVLVVDDNSPDGTQKEVQTFQKTHKQVKVLTGNKEGLGKALLRGMTYATEKMDAEIIIQMDADLSHDPAVLPKFLEKINNGDDFVVGSRYIPGGSIPSNWGVHRKIYSVVGNSFVRFGLGYPAVHDWTGGYRVFRKKYFELARADLANYSGYVFQIAFLYNAIRAGARIGEVPIKFTDRKFGRSKIAPLEYIINIYSYVFSHRFAEIFAHQFTRFAVVGAIGFTINTLILELFVLMHFHPAVGSALGAELAIISNFIFNNAWTFGDRKVTGKRIFPKFIQFNVTALGGLFIQTGSVLAGTWLTGHGSYFSWYIVGVAFGLIWNYTMYSKVIWKKHK